MEAAALVGGDLDLVSLWRGAEECSVSPDHRETQHPASLVSSLGLGAGSQQGPRLGHALLRGEGGSSQWKQPDCAPNAAMGGGRSQRSKVGGGDT